MVVAGGAYADAVEERESRALRRDVGGHLTPVRRPRNTATKPNSSVSALTAEAASISGAAAEGGTAETVISGELPLKTARFPPGVPSICSVRSESAPLGSLVLVKEEVADGSSRNNENVSFNDPPVGAFVDAST